MIPWDPLGTIANALRAAYLYLVAVFQRIVTDMPSIDNSQFADYLYGNAIGVYGYLALCVAYIAAVLALFFTKGRITFIHAILLLLLLGAIGPFWFAGADQIIIFGDQLTKAAITVGNVPVTGAGIDTFGPSILPALSFNDNMIAIFSFFPTLALGAILYQIFVNYEVLVVIVKFFGLIVLSLVALGERSRKVFSLIVAIGIVTMLIGRPVAMVIVSSGQGWVRSLPSGQDSMFTTAGVTISSLVVAILIQPVLLFLAYKSVSPVVGRVSAMVTGRVKALNENRPMPSAQDVNRVHAASLQGRATAINVHTPSYGTRVVHATRDVAVAKGAAYLVARQAVATHPVGRAALTASTVAMRALQKGPKSDT